MWFVHAEKEKKITVWLYIALSPSEDTFFNDFYFLLYILVLLFYHSVKFSHSVVSDSLWPHEPQYTRPPCPSPTPGVYPNSCPLSRWSHSSISSSVVTVSSCPQSFPALGSFQWVSSSHQLAKVLEFEFQHLSFQRTSRTDLLYDGLIGSPCSP